MVPPYTLQWVDAACFWHRLSSNGRAFLYSSVVGFDSEAEAVEDFNIFHCCM